jgi:glycosyltransferase involved in cell wall biosynthesis
MNFIAKKRPAGENLFNDFPAGIKVKPVRTRRSKSSGPIEVSVVSPFYNEAATAEEFCCRVDDALRRSGTEGYEIIAVNDGSTDETEVVLQSLKKRIPVLRNFKLSINRGQTLAIYAGIQESIGKYVMVMDSDLQHMPEEIPLFITEIRKGFDMVSGKRENRKEPLFSRKIPSLIANFMIRKLTGSKIGDQGGFKCIRGDIARKIFMRPGYHRFLPVLVQQMGGSISEIGISAPPREKGKSNYGLSRSIDVMLDILMMWFNSSGKTRPLYFLGKISVSMLFSSILLFLWLVYEKIAYGYPVANRPPFYLCILLVIISVLTFYHALTLEILSAIYRKATDDKSFIMSEPNAS